MYRPYKLADLVGGGMDLIEALLGRGGAIGYGSAGIGCLVLSARANSAWLPLITKPAITY